MVVVVVVVVVVNIVRAVGVFSLPSSSVVRVRRCSFVLQFMFARVSPFVAPLAQVLDRRVRMSYSETGVPCCAHLANYSPFGHSLRPGGRTDPRWVISGPSRAIFWTRFNPGHPVRLRFVRNPVIEALRLGLEARGEPPHSRRSLRVHRPSRCHLRGSAVFWTSSTVSGTSW